MKQIDWMIESKCNLSCAHCVHGGSIDCVNADLKSKKTTIDALKNMGYDGISFSAMEPFMSVDFQDVLKYCRYNNISISITTNGTLITQELSEELVKGHIRYIAISLEGFNSKENDDIRGNGSFHEAISGIKLIQDTFENNGKADPVVIQICLNKNNSKEIFDDLDDFISKNNIKTISFCRMEPYGSAFHLLEFCMSQKEYLDTIEKILKITNFRDKLRFRNLSVFESIYLKTVYGVEVNCEPSFCHVCENHYSIMPDGRICRCSLLINKGKMDDEDLFPNTSLNDVESNITDISSKYRLFKDGLCLTCYFRDACRPCFLNIDNGHVHEDVLISCWTYYNKLINLYLEMISDRMDYHLDPEVISSDYGSKIIFEYRSESVTLDKNGEPDILKSHKVWNLLLAGMIKI